MLALTGERLGRPLLVSPTAHGTADSLVIAPGSGLAFHPGPAADQGAASGRRAADAYLYLTSGVPKVMPYPPRWSGSSALPYRSMGLKSPAPAGSLCHTGNFAPTTHVPLTGSGVGVQEEFFPELAVRLLRRHDVYSLGITPGHMTGVLALPDLERTAFEGIGRVAHGAGPCPRWVTEGRVDLVGPERLFEIYYSSELGGWAGTRSFRRSRSGGTGPGP